MRRLPARSSPRAVVARFELGATRGAISRTTPPARHVALGNLSRRCSGWDLTAQRSISATTGSGTCTRDGSDRDSSKRTGTCSSSRGTCRSTRCERACVSAGRLAVVELRGDGRPDRHRGSLTPERSCGPSAQSTRTSTGSPTAFSRRSSTSTGSRPPRRDRRSRRCWRRFRPSDRRGAFPPRLQPSRHRPASRRRAVPRSAGASLGARPRAQSTGRVQRPGSDPSVAWSDPRRGSDPVDGCARFYVAVA